MPNSPRHVCLQKTIKEGHRRCVYRRWEAEVKGSVLITKTTGLERMYRGNTPYPIGPAKETRQTFASVASAVAALLKKCQRRRKGGYRVS